MNNLLKSVARLAPLANSSVSPLRSVINGNVFSGKLIRNVSYMCARNKLKLNSSVCCSVNYRQYSTKGEKELVDFLSEEIATERKIQKTKFIPTELDGYKVELDGSDVKLTKTLKEEIIEIHFNVNHTVDSEEPSIHESQDKPDIGELKSKPTFDVDIKRGNRTLSFTCSFLNNEADEERTDSGYDDLFGINEVSIFDGEWSENSYAIAGEVLDAYLYDLLMNLLDEKGVSNAFVEKLSDLSTAYEHNLYIGLLEGLQKFAAGK